ncbi:hypothetical protein SESBI_47417 [Sesbania bispinosa]|nr:hypothetical protein SESBI_47417 [Sesbania bispinosa]
MEQPTQKKYQLLLSTPLQLRRHVGGDSSTTDGNIAGADGDSAVAATHTRRRQSFTTDGDGVDAAAKELQQREEAHRRRQQRSGRRLSCSRRQRHKREREICFLKEG